jgi:hypothetical protein
MSVGQGGGPWMQPARLVQRVQLDPDKREKDQMWRGVNEGE